MMKVVIMKRMNWHELNEMSVKGMIYWQNETGG